MRPRIVLARSWRLGINGRRESGCELDVWLRALRAVNRLDGGGDRRSVRPEDATAVSVVLENGSSWTAQGSGGRLMAIMESPRGGDRRPPVERLGTVLGTVGSSQLGNSRKPLKFPSKFNAVRWPRG